MRAQPPSPARPASARDAEPAAGHLPLPPARRTLADRFSVEMRMVLSTLAVFNAIVLTVVGVVALAFLDRPANLPVAAVAWFVAGMLIGLGRALGR